MRAAWYEEYGPAQEVFRVGELPMPSPALGEVLVRVHNSGVNPSDWKSRRGSRGPMPYDRIIPHSDGAGVIEAVGAGVTGRTIGERVWLYNGQWQRAMGTAAEYIALPSLLAPPLPAGVDFAEGACLGVPAMTAHRAVFADGPVLGKTVLVTGGAGAVGNYAIQLAKWGGAEQVIATVSSDVKAEHAKRAGADETVNYRMYDVAPRVMQLTDGQGVDRIVEVDFGGNLPASLEMLKRFGTIASYSSGGDREPKVSYQALMRNNAVLRFVHVYSMPAESLAQAVADINQAMQEGALSHPIAARFPLHEIAAAHELQETGSPIGNIVLDIA